MRVIEPGPCFASWWGIQAYIPLVLDVVSGVVQGMAAGPELVRACFEALGVQGLWLQGAGSMCAASLWSLTPCCRLMGHCGCLHYPRGIMRE